MAIMDRAHRVARRRFYVGFIWYNDRRQNYRRKKSIVVTAIFGKKEKIRLLKTLISKPSLTHGLNGKSFVQIKGFSPRGESRNKGL